MSENKEEYFVRCKCGRLHHKSADNEMNAGIKHTLIPLICSVCNIELDFEYRVPSEFMNLEKDYSCKEHCQAHEWVEGFDSLPACRHCGVDQFTWQNERIAYLETQNRELNTKRDTTISSLKKHIEYQKQSLERKNKIIDALHYAWCSGGCEKGTHRYCDEPVTEEVVKEAISHLERLVRWFNNNSSRKSWSSATPTWQDRYFQYAELTEKARVTMNLIMGHASTQEIWNSTQEWLAGYKALKSATDNLE